MGRKSRDRVISIPLVGAGILATATTYAWYDLWRTGDRGSSVVFAIIGYGLVCLLLLVV